MLPDEQVDGGHVYPLYDLFPHDTEGQHCACKPRVAWVHGTKLVIHNSWDRREVYEHLERLWPTYEGFSYYE